MSCKATDRIPKYAEWDIEVGTNSTEYNGDINMIDDWKPVGTIKFKLYSNTPYSAKNFGAFTEGVTFPDDKAPPCTSYFPNAPKVKQHSYTGLVFHRVIPNYVAQVGTWWAQTYKHCQQFALPEGMPAEIRSSGGTVSFEGNNRFKEENFINKHIPGALALASQGPGMGCGSQVYICLNDQTKLDKLNGKYVVFGTVNSQESYNLAELIAKDPKIKYRISAARVTGYYTEDELQQNNNNQDDEKSQCPDNDLIFGNTVVNQE